MLDPAVDPYSTNNINQQIENLANDVFDLNWFQLLNAYTCTECGRCSSECPESNRKVIISQINYDENKR